MLTRGQLSATPKLIPLFDSVREIPEVLDGIRCNCGCTAPPDLRSLLSCFEGKGMARDCSICQGQARLAVRLHKEGKSLSDIRTAIDAKFR
ncbi:MAG: PCYCGC motif-containing (lipo)protein [Gemmatimonadales bacterium]